MAEIATQYVGDIHEVIRDLRNKWGYGGERSPVGNFDLIWMIGYSAACNQIKAALADKKTFSVSVK